MAQLDPLVVAIVGERPFYRGLTPDGCFAEADVDEAAGRLIAYRSRPASETEISELKGLLEGVLTADNPEIEDDFSFWRVRVWLDKRLHEVHLPRPVPKGHAWRPFVERLAEFCASAPDAMAGRVVFAGSLDRKAVDDRTWEEFLVESGRTITQIPAGFPLPSSLQAVLAYPETCMPVQDPAAFDQATKDLELGDGTIARFSGNLVLLRIWPR